MNVAVAALDEMGFFFCFLFLAPPVFRSDGDYNQFSVCNACFQF